MAARFSGAVTELHRWPVKSLGGEPAQRVRLDGRGFAGDRTHAIFDQHKGRSRRLTARQAPRLLSWGAAYVDAPDDQVEPERPPAPWLTAPDGRRLAWGDPALSTALEDDLGRPVTLLRDVNGQQDLSRSVLVTTEATLRAVERLLGRPLSLGRFRPNIHVSLDAPAFAEEDWEGGRIVIGDCELELLGPCLRCVIPTRDPDDPNDRWPELMRWIYREHGGVFGINARAHAAATIARGDDAVVTLA
ncbi:MAG: MOSC domain-containing protein [Solirubrobacteraceae bacterium]|nr:MAG: Fe-S protein [Solirubrobacterales bacterium]